MDTGRHIVGRDSTLIFSSSTSNNNINSNQQYACLPNSVSCPVISQLPDGNTIQELFKKCPAKRKRSNIKLVSRGYKMQASSRGKKSTSNDNNGALNTQPSEVCNTTSDNNTNSSMIFNTSPPSRNHNNDATTMNGQTTQPQAQQRKLMKVRSQKPKIAELKLASGQSSKLSGGAKGGAQSPQSSDNDATDKDRSKNALGKPLTRSSRSKQSSKYKASQNLQQLMRKSHAQSHQNCLAKGEHNSTQQQQKQSATSKSQPKSSNLSNSTTKRPTDVQLRVKFASSIDVKLSDSEQQQHSAATLTTRIIGGNNQKQCTTNLNQQTEKSKTISIDNNTTITTNKNQHAIEHPEPSYLAATLGPSLIQEVSSYDTSQNIVLLDEKSTGNKSGIHDDEPLVVAMTQQPLEMTSSSLPDDEIKITVVDAVIDPLINMSPSCSPDPQQLNLNNDIIFKNPSTTQTIETDCQPSLSSVFDEQDPSQRIDPNNAENERVAICDVPIASSEPVQSLKQADLGEQQNTKFQDLLTMATDQNITANSLVDPLAKISITGSVSDNTQPEAIPAQELNSTTATTTSSSTNDTAVPASTNDDIANITLKPQTDVDIDQAQRELGHEHKPKTSHLTQLGQQTVHDVASDEIMSSSDNPLEISKEPASIMATTTKTTASIIHFSMMSDNESDNHEQEPSSKGLITKTDEPKPSIKPCASDMNSTPLPRRRTSLLGSDNSSSVSPSSPKMIGEVANSQHEAIAAVPKVQFRTKAATNEALAVRESTLIIAPEPAPRYSSLQLSMLSDDDEDDDIRDDIDNNEGFDGKLMDHDQVMSSQGNSAIRTSDAHQLVNLDEFSKSSISEVSPNSFGSNSKSSSRTKSRLSRGSRMSSGKLSGSKSMSLIDSMQGLNPSKSALMFPQLNEGLSSDAESAGDDCEEDDDDYAMDADVEADDEDFGQEDDEDDDDDDEDDDEEDVDEDDDEEVDYANQNNNHGHLFSSMQQSNTANQLLDNHKTKSVSSYNLTSNSVNNSYTSASAVGASGSYVISQPEHHDGSGDLQPNGESRHSMLGYSTSNGQSSFWPSSSSGYQPVPSTSRGLMNGIGSSNNQPSGLNRSQISSNTNPNSNSSSFGRDDGSNLRLAKSGSNQRLSSDTDNETDRLLGSQRKLAAAASVSSGVVDSLTSANEPSGPVLHHSGDVDGVRPSGSSTNNSREILIEGNLFNVKYLGSTHADCENRSDKEDRIHQAEMAVQQVKYRNGDSQLPIEVQLFISTEKIMVLDDKNRKIMMDHSLRTVSYIADIGEAIVLIVRKRVTLDAGTELARPIWKYSCHVFESPDSHTITKSISQAFQVAFNELMKANGGGTSSDLTSAAYLGKELDYQEICNSQEMSTDELEMFAKKENQREVVVPKAKGEKLGIGIVESGWGSVLPTVVIASLKQGSPAYRCKNLSIGDQILSINGISLVGLPLAECQDILSRTRRQTVARLYIVPSSITVEVKIKRPDTKYQLGFSVQNGVICSLLRGGIAERGGVRVGHRIMSINGTTVVGVPHEKIVSLLASSVGEIHMKTCLTSLYRLILREDNPVHF